MLAYSMKTGSNSYYSLCFVKRLAIGAGLLLTLAGNKRLVHAPAPRPIRVSIEYLEACERGPTCKPITVYREKGEQLELVLPGLLRTSVSIWDEVNYSKFLKRTAPYQPIQQTGSSEVGERREINLSLSKLKDGTYYVWVVGDSAGGIFQVYLKTN